jgi:hypothetical protein
VTPIAEDDGFHEIQLNGKQLVFLFMAATVVSVVIFLCGVLVGRGVRVERGAAAETADDALEQRAIGQYVLGPLQEKHRDLDLRQVGGARVGRLACGV